MPRTSAPSARMAPPRASPGTTTNPGARRAKEHQLLSMPLAARRRRPHRERRERTSFQMTLGNGYLGSRIDEERSEMRYLV